MKKIQAALILAAACALTAFNAAAESATPPANPAAVNAAGGKPAGYKLVWADEFDKPGLPNPAKWDYDTGMNKTGWANNELQ